MNNLFDDFQDQELTEHDLGISILAVVVCGAAFYAFYSCSDKDGDFE